MSTLTKLIPIIAPVFGGALYALSNVGFAYWYLSILVLPFLWYGLSSKKLRVVSFTKFLLISFGLGFLFGLSAYVLGFHWLLYLSNGFTNMPFYLFTCFWLISACWFALWFGLYALAFNLFRSLNTPLLFHGIAPLILIEGLQIQLFPSFLGAALVESTHLVQIANLGGSLLLSALVAFISVCLYSSFQAKKLSAALPGIIALALAWGYGEYQIPRSHITQHTYSSEGIKIGLIQSNLVRKSQDELSLISHKEHLALSKSLLDKDKNIDLLIWPETAYARGIRRPLPLDAQFILGDINTPLIFGASSIWQHEGQKVHSNSVLLADNKGQISQAYDKNLLIPFAEYLPFEQTVNEEIQQLFPYFQAFKQGTQNQSLTLNQLKITTPICYEIIHPEFVRRSVKHNNTNLIITLANDAWFAGSQEPMIHLRLAQLRAVEHKRWVVRATNSGISALIAPNGQIIDKTAFGEQAILSGTVYPVASSTIYTEYGDAPLLTITILSLFMLLIRRSRHIQKITVQTQRERLIEEG